MAKFEIALDVTTTIIREIEAEDSDSAKDIMENMYRNGEIDPLNDSTADFDYYVYQI